LADRIEKEAAAIRKETGVNARALAADLSSAAARERIAHAFPDIDILVNNAGAIPGGSIDQVYEPAWCAGWDLKVYGYIGLTRLYNAALFEKNERTAQRRYH
jgi:3-oxoacyl-[acyl-carrier protein] reductase